MKRTMTSLLKVEQIDGWLTQAKELSSLYVGGIIALLSFSDLFIAVPTLMAFGKLSKSTMNLRII